MSRRIICGWVCGALVLGGVARGQGVQAASPGLPAPSGTYSVGRAGYDLTDGARMDAYARGESRHRELMVYVWYPAEHRNGKAAGEYVPRARELDRNAEARDAVRDEFGARWPLIVSGAIGSHAVAGAAPVRGVGKFPVIVFSHGIGDTSFSYTAQIEDLVSHGYVVVAIEHTDAAGVVLFDDGHVRLQHEAPAPAGVKSGTMEAMIASAEAGTQMGAEDVRFVLDRFEGGTVPLARMMDWRRVGAVGHSYGGDVTARVCQLDARIKACISEDGEVNPVGVYFDYPDHRSFEQPFLLMEIDWHPSDEMLGRMHESRAEWEGYVAHEREQLSGCVAGSYHVILKGAGMTHASFSDGLLLSAAPGSQDAATALENLLSIEAVERSFLDKVLKGEAAPLLDEARAGMEVERIGR